MVFDGLFERFPTLQIVLVEHANSWILPLMWRMDAIYGARRAELDHLTKKPSEYVYDHIWFTTQPLDFPEDRAELAKTLEWMQADRLLLFSTDYPHWTFDDPKWVIRQIPEKLREAIMFRNGLELYDLPSTVPALEGQTRVW
jgi:predicted TIM-barrel fold metal-dependent hydrolase